MKQKIARNIQAVLVFIAPVAAHIFVPGNILLPIAWTLLPVSIAGVFGIRAYMQRLHAALSAPEADEMSIRERQFLLTELGVLLALVGLAAFFVLLLEYTD